MARGPKCPHCGKRLPVAVNPDRIMAAVTHVSNVSRAAIRSKARARTVTAARWAAIVLLRDLTDYSYPEIGALLRRDHSTVINAYRKHRQKVAVLSLVNQARETLRARGMAA